MISLIGLTGSDAAPEGYDEGYDDQGQYAGEEEQGGFEPEMDDQRYEQPRQSEPVHNRRRNAPAQEYEAQEDNNVFAGRRASARDNVVHMNAAERKHQKLRVENLMPEVSSVLRMNQACEHIINHVMGGEILIISTVNIDEAQRTRMVLMLSGAAFAMGAHFSRVNSVTYMMAPNNVDVSEEAAKPNPPSFFEGSDFFGSK